MVKLRIFHFGMPPPEKGGNFGDDVIFSALRQTFDRIFEDYEIEWVTRTLRLPVVEEVIEKVNSCDLVVLGAGGLLIKDSNKGSVSGWQWNCSVEGLKKINKPLVVYSIGYNRFRNQEEFDAVFFDHLKETIDKAAIFSVRNSGSKRALDNYGVFPDKIRINPCPSIFYRSQLVRSNQETGRIGVNLAGDRAQLRFDDKWSFYSDMDKFLKGLIKKGYEIHFMQHGPDNCNDFFASFNGSKFHHNMTAKNIDKHIETYQSLDLMLAMRGHAQMIPFGQHKKVVSLVSHPKLSWFLEDVGMEDTQVEINGGNFYENLVETFERILVDKDYYRRQDEALQRLATMFAETNSTIRGLV